MKMWFCFLEKTVSHGEAQGIEAVSFFAARQKDTSG
jgi:hypothetical protein